MTPFHREYLDIAAQLQTFLIQEYPVASWIAVNRESYAYYRSYAKNAQAPAIVAHSTSIPQPSKSSTPLQELKKPLEAVSEKPIITSEHHKKPSTDVKEVTSHLPKSYQAIAAAPPPSQYNPKVILLDIPGNMEPHPLADIHKIVSERFPDQILLDHPPNDLQAKTVKNAWKQPSIKNHVILLLSSPQPSDVPFITQVARAIRIVYGIDVKICEKPLEDESESYVIKLAALETYIHEPQKKAELWKIITDQIKAP